MFHFSTSTSGWKWFSRSARIFCLNIKHKCYVFFSYLYKQCISYDIKQQDKFWHSLSFLSSRSKKTPQKRTLWVINTLAGRQLGKCFCPSCQPESTPGGKNLLPSITIFYYKLRAYQEAAWCQGYQTGRFKCYLGSKNGWKNLPSV